MSISENYSIRGCCQSRVFFGKFTPENDQDSSTGRSGIRTHWWITSLFLRIFGKISYVKTANKTLYLNANSLEKWLNRHKEADSIPNLTLENRINNICKKTFEPIVEETETQDNPSNEKATHQNQNRELRRKMLQQKDFKLPRLIAVRENTETLENNDDLSNATMEIDVKLESETDPTIAPNPLREMREKPINHKEIQPLSSLTNKVARDLSKLNVRVNKLWNLIDKKPEEVSVADVIKLLNIIMNGTHQFTDLSKDFEKDTLTKTLEKFQTNLISVSLIFCKCLDLAFDKDKGQIRNGDEVLENQFFEKYGKFHLDQKPNWPDFIKSNWKNKA